MYVHQTQRWQWANLNGSVSLFLALAETSSNVITITLKSINCDIDDMEEVERENSQTDKFV